MHPLHVYDSGIYRDSTRSCRSLCQWFAWFTISALMLGTDHRGTPSRRGVVSLRLGYAHRGPTDCSDMTSAPSRRENESSSNRRLVLPLSAGGTVQARRQDIVDGSSRLHSTRGSWYGHRKQRASSIGETEINV